MTEAIVQPKPTLGQRMMRWTIIKLIKVMGWFITLPFRVFWSLIKKL